MINTMKKSIRQFLVGADQEFRFISYRKDSFNFPEIEATNLYIHIPFCRSLCPYCPYNRVPYDENKVKIYFEALLKEIDMYYEQYGSINISSIYIGGGTPTNAIDHLNKVISKIKDKFNFEGDLAIETTVSDINFTNLSKLEDLGVNLLSVGVQSFDDDHLEFLGRNYKSKDISKAFEIIDKFSFDTINIDLIFAYPNQNKQSLINDLKEADKLKVDQITTYPLFTFPYSNIGEYLKLNKIKMPKFFVRKRFYDEILDFFEKNNYKKVSVWGFKKKLEGNDRHYSSVTRNYYIGLGAGAGSRFESIFYFNTFSIESYIDSIISKDKLPISIYMPITKKLSHYYWFYWKLYQTNFSLKEFKNIADSKMNLILKTFKVLNFIKIDNDRVSLTDKGSFWVHFFQNHFVLDYINIVWKRMKEEDFPDFIDI